MIDVFKDEYHLNKQQGETLEEARDMMKYKPVKQTPIVHKNQYNLDYEEFERHYNAWRYDTIIHSDPEIIFENQHFQSIIKMGKRAVPFIYKILSKQDDFVVCALAEIYCCNLSKPGKYLGIANLCKMWKQKLEREGEI